MNRWKLPAPPKIGWIGLHVMHSVCTHKKVVITIIVKVWNIYFPVLVLAGFVYTCTKNKWSPIKLDSNPVQEYKVMCKRCSVCAEIQNDKRTATQTLKLVELHYYIAIPLLALKIRLL